jgi:hypothetical protein
MNIFVLTAADVIRLDARRIERVRDERDEEREERS